SDRAALLVAVIIALAVFLEVVGGGDVLVAEEEEGVTMNLIGAGAFDHVDDGADGAGLLGAEVVGDDGEFADAVRAYVIAEAADDYVKLLEAVNENVGLATAGAGDADFTDASLGGINRRGADDLRDEGGKVGEVAVLQRQRDDLFAADDLPDI